MKSRRCGVYFRVIEEGDVGAGDSVLCTYQEPVRLPFALAALVGAATPDLDRASPFPVAALLPEWREFFSEIAGQPINR
jgi:MOSC domain-containing protein YiiM